MNYARESLTVAVENHYQHHMIQSDPRAKFTSLLSLLMKNIFMNAGYANKNESDGN